MRNQGGLSLSLSLFFFLFFFSFFSFFAPSDETVADPSRASWQQPQRHTLVDALRQLPLSSSRHTPLCGGKLELVPKRSDKQAGRDTQNKRAQVAEKKKKKKKKKKKEKKEKKKFSRVELSQKGEKGVELF